MLYPTRAKPQASTSFAGLFNPRGYDYFLFLQFNDSIDNSREEEKEAGGLAYATMMDDVTEADEWDDLGVILRKKEKEKRSFDLKSIYRMTLKWT